MIKEQRFLPFIIFILLLNMANANILMGRTVPFLIGLILLFKYYQFNSLIFSKKFLYIVGFWILINLSSMTINETSFNIFRLIINTIRLLFLPYLLLIIYGSKFWPTFEKVIYLLTRISLVIFVFNIAFPGFFYSLQKVFSIFTTQGLMVNPGYWSAFVYVNAFADNGYGSFRFNGFMWEPGAMAMLIIWAMLYNAVLNGFKFDKKFLVYLISLIVTYSTAGYIAFAFILLAKYFKKITIYNVIIIALLSIFTYFSYSRLEFIAGKLNIYTEEFNEDKFGEKGNIEVKVNRFQAFGAVLMRIKDQPFGFGLLSAIDRNDYEYSAGVNGLGSLLEMWGIPFFLYFLFLFYKYFRTIEGGYRLNNYGTFFCVSALLIPIASNPSERTVFVYLILLTPLVLNKNHQNVIIINEK